MRPGRASWAVRPATVLDPFVGSGSTCLAASRLGRDSIGVELQPAYAEIARRRLGETPLFAAIRPDEGDNGDAPLLTAIEAAT